MAVAPFGFGGVVVWIAEFLVFKIHHGIALRIKFNGIIVGIDIGR